MKDSDLLKQAKAHFKLAVDAEGDCRSRMADDVNFLAGEQWPDGILRAREQDPTGPRPCLVVNLTKKHVLAVVNDIRQNRPQIRALPVDDEADPDTAEMLNGLLRHIQVTSDADIAYDCAAEAAVTGGLGWFYIVPEVVDEERNLQELRIKPVWNWSSAYIDPHIEHPAGADARFGFLVEDMARAEFEQRWPKAEIADWRDVADDDSALWYPDDSTVRVAHYWYVEESPRKVHWCRLSGDAVLEATEFPSRYIGLIRVPGEERIVSGKRDLRGIVRDLRDPARMYNYWSSASAEHLALAPKAKHYVSIEAIEGHEDRWAAANTSNDAYLPYNSHDLNGNPLPPPQRVDSVSQNTGLIQAMQQAAEDMRSVSGQYEASFGAPSNEKSGVAIRERQRESQTATFHYVDNLNRALKHAGRVLIDMVPQVYDTRRVVRLLGEDDSPDFAVIDPNQPQAMTREQDFAGRVQAIYNPGVGHYDVVVSTGPSFGTRRQEAFEAMSQVLGANPQLWSVIGDLLVKNMDWPGADDMAERMRALLPPEVRQLEQDNPEDAVRQQIMAQVQPMVEELQGALQQAGMEVDQRDAKIAELEEDMREKMMELQVKAQELEYKRMELQHKQAVAEMRMRSDLEKARAQAVSAQVEADSEVAVARIQRGDAPDESLQPIVEAIQQLSQQLQALQQASAAQQVKREATLERVLGYLASGDPSEAGLQGVVQDVRVLN